MTSFTQHKVFKVHPCCSMYQYFITSFYVELILNCMVIPHFVYLFIMDCFHFLAIGIMPLFTFVYTFLCDHIFISVPCIPGNGVSRSFASLFRLSGAAKLQVICLSVQTIRSCQTAFQNGCSILLSYQQYVKVLVCPHPHQYSLLSVCWYSYPSCSVYKLCLTLCNSMNCSMPGFPVLHSVPEFAQIHLLSQ